MSEICMKNKKKICWKYDFGVSDFLMMMWMDFVIYILYFFIIFIIMVICIFLLLEVFVFEIKVKVFLVVLVFLMKK